MTGSDHTQPAGAGCMIRSVKNGSLIWCSCMNCEASTYWNFRRIRCDFQNFYTSAH